MKRAWHRLARTWDGYVFAAGPRPGAVRCLVVVAGGRAAVNGRFTRRDAAAIRRAFARRNPVEDHGETLDQATQDEIDEAFRTLPVRVYGRGR